MFKKRKEEEWNPWEINETENSETFNTPAQKDKKVFGFIKKRNCGIQVKILIILMKMNIMSMKKRNFTTASLKSLEYSYVFFFW